VTAPIWAVGAAIERGGSVPVGSLNSQADLFPWSPRRKLFDGVKRPRHADRLLQAKPIAPQALNYETSTEPTMPPS
jgi:hypothetical protein